MQDYTSPWSYHGLVRVLNTLWTIELECNRGETPGGKAQDKGPGRGSAQLKLRTLSCGLEPSQRSQSLTQKGWSQILDLWLMARLNLENWKNVLDRPHLQPRQLRGLGTGEKTKCLHCLLGKQVANQWAWWGSTCLDFPSILQHTFTEN